MAIEKLLGDTLTASQFVGETFLRFPFSMPGGATEFRDLAQWPIIERIVQRPTADILIVKQGQQRARDSALDPDVLRALFHDGHTILVRHAEREDDRLRQLAESFTRDFHAPVDVHVYCTPKSLHGFGWHYDAEDVFILQTAGVKEFSLRKNTVNPWPVAETLPRNMRYERELMPLMKCRLQAGDWLYIPHGYWHQAVAEEDSISLAVGVMMPSAVDLLTPLREFLLNSLRWRQRLPVTGAAAEISRDELEAVLAERLAELAPEIESTLQSPAFVRRVLDSLCAESAVDNPQ